MDIAKTMSLMDLVASGFKGAKPGKRNLRSSHKVLDEAKKYWSGGDGSFQIELQRECDAEDPRMKLRSFGQLTKTQRMSVAKRLHSKAVARHRASRQK